jgi:hypothetical protein
MVESRPALQALAAEVPICPSCLSAEGLCIGCGRAVLPQLKQPSWYREAHSGIYAKNRRKAEDAELTAEAHRVKARKERKRNRRFLRALSGEHTRVTRAA